GRHRAVEGSSLPAGRARWGGAAAAHRGDGRAVLRVGEPRAGRDADLDSARALPVKSTNSVPVIRPPVPDDLEVLWDFLAMAAYEADVEAANGDPRVAKYLVGWRRPGDFGFVAEQNGDIIGAAWARRLSADELTVPYGDEDSPKVSIGVN